MKNPEITKRLSAFTKPRCMVIAFYWWETFVGPAVYEPSSRFVFLRVQNWNSKLLLSYLTTLRINTLPCRAKTAHCFIAYILHHAATLHKHVFTACTRADRQNIWKALISCRHYLLIIRDVGWSDNKGAEARWLDGERARTEQGYLTI